MKTLIFPLLFIYLSGLTYAQKPEWINYRASNNIESIVAEDNFIWAGTSGGLVKIDTATGTTMFYNQFNSGLPYDYVTSIALDENHTKWIGTSFGGVAEFDGTNWTLFNESNSDLPSNMVYSIKIDKSGNKWIGTSDGLAKYDGSNWTLFNTSNSGLPDDYVSNITFDRKGIMWIGTAFGGLAKFDGSVWTTYNPSNSDIPGWDVYSTAIDKADDIWIVGATSLSKFDGTLWTNYDVSNSGIPVWSVESIAIDSLDNKWIGTGSGGGLVKFNGTNWLVYNNIPAFDISLITIDEMGNKWIGSYAQGLIKFDGIKSVNYCTGLPSDYILSITADGNGNKWIGTGDHGLVKFDGLNWTTYPSSVSGLTYAPRSIAAENNENIWIGSRGGLTKFDGFTWTNFDISNSGLPDNSIVCVAIDETGNKWIGTEKNGIVKYDGNNWTIYNTANSGLPSDTVQSLAISKTGDIWIGTDDGLAKFNEAGWSTYNTANSDLPSNSILTIAIDSLGTAWINSGRSLTKFDGLTWTTYDSQNSGLPGFVSTLAIDQTGHKWIGTLPVCNPSVCLGGALVEFDDTNWTIYDISNSPLYNFNINSICIDANNNKWIGSEGGIAVYNKTGYDPVNDIPDIIFTDRHLLSRNYPNPFNSITTISFDLPVKANVTLKIYDIQGREIETLCSEMLQPATYTRQWNGSNRPDGVYYYQLKVGQYTETNKILLIK